MKQVCYQETGWWKWQQFSSASEALLRIAHGRLKSFQNKLLKNCEKKASANTQASMLYNRIKERELWWDKVGEIIDPFLKTSALFDGSQKSMPTEVSKKTFVMQNPAETPLWERFPRELAKLETGKAEQLSGFVQGEILNLKG